MATFTVRTSFAHVYNQVAYGSASLTPSAVITGAVGNNTVACGNCQIGDIVDVSCPAVLGNLIVQGEVTAIGTVTIKFANTSGGSLTPPAGIYKVVSYTLGADFQG